MHLMLCVDKLCESLVSALLARARTRVVVLTARLSTNCILHNAALSMSSTLDKGKKKATRPVDEAAAEDRE